MSKFLMKAQSRYDQPTTLPGIHMKTSHALAAASLALLSSIATAQMPPGVTMEMVNTVLPEDWPPG